MVESGDKINCSLNLLPQGSAQNDLNIDNEYQSALQTARTPFHDMLPHLHTIYNDVILLNVLTEV